MDSKIEEIVGLLHLHGGERAMEWITEIRERPGRLAKIIKDLRPDQRIIENAEDEDIQQAISNLSYGQIGDILESIKRQADAASQLTKPYHHYVERLHVLLQKYGMAWYSMWMLELRESSARLPGILQEIHETDAELLAAAQLPAIQQAVAAIETPTAHEPSLNLKETPMTQPTEPKTTLELGVEALQSGDEEQARALFDLARRENPQDSEAWRWSASTAETESERIQFFERAFFLAPDNHQIADSLSMEGTQFEMIAAIELLGLINGAGEPYLEWILERDEAKITELFKEMTQDERIRGLAANTLVQKLMIARLDEFIRPTTEPAQQVAQQLVTLDDLPASHTVVNSDEDLPAPPPTPTAEPQTRRVSLFGLEGLLGRRSRATVPLDEAAQQASTPGRIRFRRAATQQLEPALPEQVQVDIPEGAADHLLDAQPVVEDTQPQPTEPPASQEPELIGLGDFALPTAPAAVPVAEMSQPVTVAPKRYPRWHIWRYGWFWWLITLVLAVGFLAWAFVTSPYPTVPARNNTPQATVLPTTSAQPTLAPTAPSAPTAAPAAIPTQPQSPTVAVAPPTTAPTSPPPSPTVAPSATSAPVATVAPPPTQPTATMPRRLITSPTKP